MFKIFISQLTEEHGQFTTQRYSKIDWNCGQMRSDSGKILFEIIPICGKSYD
jgi:hypothetical protein